jgi:hypothetical protein
MAPRQIAYPVPHYRAGRRTRVRLLAFHTSEGARTVESLGSFLRRRGGASYHAGTDDDKIAYYVNRRNEAWHLRNGNPMSDGFVFCGFASWTRAQWFEHPVMLENGAWWLASCAAERGLPLRWLSVADTASAVRSRSHIGGTCDHDDYSDATRDGTHWDCGEGFPKDWVINRAIEIQGAQPAPTPGPSPDTTGGTVIPIQLDPTPEPDNWDDSATWPWREVVVPLGYVQGWRGRLWLRFAAMHPGGRIFRAHVDYPDGDRVRFANWADVGDWPGIHVEPPYKATRQYAYQPPKGAGTLMFTYAAPKGGGLNLEWER